MTQSKPPPPPGAGRDRPPERYPSVRQDDAIERTGRTRQVTGETRSFGEAARPAPADEASEGSSSVEKDRLGPQGDPAEGKP